MFLPVVLPQGSRIRNCRIEKRLGKGGFGITYLATEFASAESEAALGPELRLVAIKEFFPNGIAARENGHTVSPIHDVEGAFEAFQTGLRAFYKEAQAIAGLDHENVIRLLSVFEANGTAYFIMPYLKGESLRALLKREGTLSEERTRRLLLPVLDGLAHAHAKGILHRDIKPDNVMIREDDGRTVLIDFGTARAQAASEVTRYTRLTDLVAYTPGYAALEQYSRAANDNRHGPWTDLYAFGALLFEAVTGTPPQESAMRVAELGGGHADPLMPVSIQLQDTPGYGRAFLMAIDWALEISAKDRPQSVNELRDALNGRRMPSAYTLERLEAQGVSTEQFTVVPGAAARMGTRAVAPAVVRQAEAPAPMAPTSQHTAAKHPESAAPTLPPQPRPAATQPARETRALQADPAADQADTIPETTAPKKMPWLGIIAGIAVLIVAGMATLNLPQRPDAAAPVGVAPATPPATAAPQAAPASPNAAIQAQPDAVALAKARQARDQAQALFQQARDLISEEGGKPEIVLAMAGAALDHASGTLARGDAGSAAQQFDQAATLIRARVHNFLEQLVANYSKIAAAKMAVNDLRTAQTAIEKAKQLKQLEAEYE